jgi:hypothetical protein
MMKTLFLHPPSFDGFDGGAGSRYQAKREIRSFWYPTWLAQPAALVPDSRLVDAPPAKLSLTDVLPLAGGYELAVLHTSTPSFASDIRVAEALKDENPRLKIGMVGAKVAVEPEDSLKASSSIDFVAREEFDFTIKEVAEGRPLEGIDGLSFRNPNGGITHNRDRAVLEDMDRLPFVTEVYKRDLRVEDYFIGYLKHPYLSRMPIEMYLLPVAADGRRAPLSRPQRRPRGRGNSSCEELLPTGQGVLLRRRHFHRRPPASRGDRARIGQARRDMVVQRQGQRSARDPRSHARQRAAPAAGGL